MRWLRTDLDNMLCQGASREFNITLPSVREADSLRFALYRRNAIGVPAEVEIIITNKTTVCIRPRVRLQQAAALAHE